LSFCPRNPSFLKHARGSSPFLPVVSYRYLPANPLPLLLRLYLGNPLNLGPVGPKFFSVCPPSIGSALPEDFVKIQGVSCESPLKAKSRKPSFLSLSPSSDSFPPLFLQTIGIYSFSSFPFDDKRSSLRQHLGRGLVEFPFTLFNRMRHDGCSPPASVALTPLLVEKGRNQLFVRCL